MADELTPLPELLENLKYISEKITAHRKATELVDGWSATRWNNLYDAQVDVDDAAHALWCIIENDKKKEQEND